MGESMWMCDNMLIYYAYTMITESENHPVLLQFNLLCLKKTSRHIQLCLKVC